MVQGYRFLFCWDHHNFAVDFVCITYLILGYFVCLACLMFLMIKTVRSCSDLFAKTFGSQFSLVKLIIGPLIQKSVFIMFESYLFDLSRPEWSRKFSKNSTQVFLLEKSWLFSAPLIYVALCNLLGFLVTTSELCLLVLILKW